MQDVFLRKNEDYIKLGQLLKKAGVVTSGVEAKILIEEGHIFVNGESETRRGRKLYRGDKVTFEEETFRVVQ